MERWGSKLKLRDHLFAFTRQEAVERTQLFAKPQWFTQSVADMKRHEGFYEFAYPDPLSPLARKYPIAKYWGRRPGNEVLAELGEKESLGRPWTVGYGFTHGVTPASRISRAYADRRLEEEVMDHAIFLDDIYPKWKTYPLVVQTVLVNLIFNMGPNTLKDFKTTNQYIREGKYELAGQQLKKSLWFKQVGTRGREITDRLINMAIAPEHRV